MGRSAILLIDLCCCLFFHFYKQFEHYISRNTQLIYKFSNMRLDLKIMYIEDLVDI